MKDLSLSVLHDAFEVVFSVPSTNEEFDNALGEVGSLLEEGNRNVVYRNTLPRFYRTASKALAEKGDAKVQQTDNDGVAKTTKRKDGTLVPVMESDIDHVTRIHQNGDDAKKKEVGELLHATGKTLKFYEARTGEGGGGKIPQYALDAVQPHIDAGPEAANAAAEKIEGLVPGYKVARDVDGQVTVESLARGVVALQKKLDDESKAKRQSLLA